MWATSFSAVYHSVASLLGTVCLLGDPVGENCILGCTIGIGSPVLIAEILDILHLWDAVLHFMTSESVP